MSTAKKLDPVGSLYDFEDIKLTDKMFEKLATRMYDLAGVDLPPSPKNHALIRNRIVKLLRRHKFATYEEYWEMLQKGDQSVISEFISALTTNMTSFYRESNHFDFLVKEIPVLQKKFGDLRIWCAAASTGQEPYTLAMTVCEALPETLAPKTKILATDIDLQVLKKASIGTYEEREMQGLPPTHRHKYFDKQKAADGLEMWRTKDSLNKLLRFAPFNLMNPRYDFQFKFHIVICRNVLIYFDEATTKKVIDNLVDCVAPGGYLILGHSESGNVKHAKLKPLSRAIYQKV